MGRQRRRKASSKHVPYEVYLKSDHWKELKNLWLPGTDCYGCDFGEKLEIHHINYENLWGEQPDDIIILCRRCHTKLHDALDSHYDGKTTAYKALRTVVLFEKVFGRTMKSACEKYQHSTRTEDAERPVKKKNKSKQKRKKRHSYGSLPVKWSTKKKGPKMEHFPKLQPNARCISNRDCEIVNGRMVYLPRDKNSL